VVNALTTTRHLGNSIPQGDWIMAGFDLAALACGAVAAICALKVKKSQSTALMRRRPKAAATQEPPLLGY
jgi:hypothetical protein